MNDLDRVLKQIEEDSKVRAEEFKRKLKLEEARFNFSDGSVFFIGDETYNYLSILRKLTVLQKIEILQIDEKEAKLYFERQYNEKATHLLDLLSRKIEDRCFGEPIELDDPQVMNSLFGIDISKKHFVNRIKKKMYSTEQITTFIESLQNNTEILIRDNLQIPLF